MTRVAGLLCVLLSLVCSPALATTCWVPKTPVSTGNNYQRNMFVVSGKWCGLVLLNTPGPMRGVRLIAPPTSGRVVISGQRITYVSRRGYLGHDHFVFVREGMDSGNRSVTWTIDMSVEVKERL
jgi:hypothetical protein